MKKFLKNMFENIENIYFIGIGGIGMSALARYFKSKGYFVAGYDRTPTQLTQDLQKEGIQIHFEDHIDLIPSVIKEGATSQSLIIYTPAVPSHHQQLNYFKDKNYFIKKRAEVLGEFTKDHFTIAVAGTHGKTTTSSLIAYILQKSSKPCIAFIGGILQNSNTNFIEQYAPDKALITVVEADEYDRSFLHLHPNIAVITAMDADHLEIYGNKSNIEVAFTEFAEKIQENGRLLLKKNLTLGHHIDTQGLVMEHYALHEETNYYAKNIQIKDGKFYFDFISKDTQINNIELNVPGFHNVENAVAAIAVAINLQIDPTFIKEAIASYRGVKRRFEYIIQRDNFILIDDYAHHPVEVEAFLNSVKALYPQRKITAIFQPHLYTRTRDFAAEFAQSLSLADEVILLDIYPAREEPIEGVTSKLILNKISIEDKKIYTKEQVLEAVQKQNFDILLTIGAGDIHELGEKIKNMLV
jgi:UDP-N-acetylmuramate--alanine ligase